MENGRGCVRPPEGAPAPQERGKPVLQRKWNRSSVACNQMVKRLRETRVQSLGWEALLEKEMATHSSTLAWKIPWTKEPGRLQSMGSQRVTHDWTTSLSLLDILLISHHHKKKGEYSTIRYFETQRERERETTFTSFITVYCYNHSTLLSAIVTNLWNVTNL